MEIIFTRKSKGYNRDFEKGHILELYDEYDSNNLLDGIPDICYINLDENIIGIVIDSSSFHNWISEKTAPIVNPDHPVNIIPSIPKNRETAIMYLMDLGLSSDRICNLIY